MSALLLSSSRNKWEKSLETCLWMALQMYLPKRKFSGFQIDLIDQFSSWCYNNTLRFLQFFKTTGRYSITHHMSQNWQEKSCLEVKLHNLQVYNASFSLWKPISHALVTIRVFFHLAGEFKVRKENNFYFNEFLIIGIYAQII